MATNYGSIDRIPSAEKISTLVSRITSNLVNLRQIVQTLTELSNVLGGPKDSITKRDEIQKQQKRANNLLSMTKSLFETSAMVQNVDEQSKLQMIKTKVEYERVIQKYSDIQKTIMEKMRRVSEAAHQSHANDFNESSSYYQGDQTQLVSETEDQTDVELAMQQDIERRMIELNKELIDVQGMFTEMNKLVVDDRERIDAIEQNVEIAAEQTDNANEKLKQAVVYKKSAFKKKIILAIIIIVILAIIGIIIGVEVNKKN